MTNSIMKKHFHLPPAQGLYDPELEKDACGVGFIAHIKGVPSHQNVLDADQILQAMDHRGACGCRLLKLPWMKVMATSVPDSSRSLKSSIFLRRFQNKRCCQPLAGKAYRPLEVTRVSF